jgi:hypothetical protein
MKTVVFVVSVSRFVDVTVCVAVPPLRMLLQNNSASAVCPTKESRPHSETIEFVSETFYIDPRYRLGRM